MTTCKDCRYFVATLHGKGICDHEPHSPERLGILGEKPSCEHFERQPTLQDPEVQASLKRIIEEKAKKGKS